MQPSQKALRLEVCGVYAPLRSSVGDLFGVYRLVCSRRKVKPECEQGQVKTMEKSGKYLMRINLLPETYLW